MLHYFSGRFALLTSVVASLLFFGRSLRDFLHFLSGWGHLHGVNSRYGR